MVAPVVIAGCGRSGTSLLLSVLSCHPDLHAIPQETSALLGRPLQLDGFPRDRRWVEKTPMNILNLEVILSELPQARVLNIVRDGRDVITSRHPLRVGRYVTSERWVRDVSAGVPFDEHERVFVLGYRELVCSYEPTLRRLCAFLDIPFAPEFLRYPETASVRTHAAWSGPARPVSAAGVGRWRHPEFAAEVAEFMANAEAVALLEHYGFEV